MSKTIKDDDEEKDQGTFSKKTFTRYIDSNCQRQLVWKLSRKYPEKWLKGQLEPRKNNSPRRESEYLQKRGDDYEDRVYRHILAHKKEFHPLYLPGDDDSHRVLKPMSLGHKRLLNFYNVFLKTSKMQYLLLENQFNTPISFLQQYFFIDRPPKTNLINNSEKNGFPVDYRRIRPDIMIIGNVQFRGVDTVHELLSNGEIRVVPKKELKKRLGVTIFDIKNVIKKKIGKRQFIEIIFYLWAMSCLLKDIGLSDKIFVSLERNGIIPPEDEELTLDEVLSADSLYDFSIKFSWKASYRIFKRMQSEVRSLWKNAPMKIHDSEMNINTTCAFCRYFADCLTKLDYYDPEDESIYDNTYSEDPNEDGFEKYRRAKPDIGLELIPYNSTSISKLLKSRGCETIEDVHEYLKTFKFGSDPNPLMPEYNLLKLKTKAFLHKDIQMAGEGELHSYNIPKNAPIAIIFSIETAPPNDSIFAVSVYLTMSVPRKFSYGIMFERWWTQWSNYISGNLDLADMTEILNEFLEVEIEEESVYEFARILDTIKRNLVIVPRGYQWKNGSVQKYLRVAYKFSDMNYGDEPQCEAVLVSAFIKSFYQILKMSDFLEEFIRVPVSLSDDNTFYDAPETAIFHWSEEQFENLQASFERNISYIISQPELEQKFTDIINWINPEESEVSNPYRYKKIYDLRKFIESVAGIPTIINYTWHNIALNELQKVIFYNYWPKYFNFMDFSVWYRYLGLKYKHRAAVNLNHQGASNSNLVSKFESQFKKQEEKIKRQVLEKSKILNTLRIKFQVYGKDLISRYSRPISTQKYKSISIGQEFHDIAHVWYLFAKLTASTGAKEIEEIRTTFPEESIGHLNAAEIAALTPMLDIKSKKNKRRKKDRYFYIFELIDVNKNVKLDVGDHVLVLPNELRDINSGYQLRKWTVKIEEMVWMQTLPSTKKQGYLVRTEPSYVNLEENYHNEKGHNPANNVQWYIYPTAMDAWSSKLYHTVNQNKSNTKPGLLQRENLGESWLGRRLSYLWDIRTNPQLTWPREFMFNTPEVYMYAPDVLTNFVNKLRRTSDDSEEFLIKTLKTDIHYPPDPSQKNSIIAALNNVIYGIQGPPGTGKSTTITALVDEFYIRKKSFDEPVRILITAFSYNAIRVLIDKIRNSKNEYGQPTQSSQMQMVFIRSQFQSSITDEPGLPHVNDLVRSSGSWKWDGQSRIITPRAPLTDQLEEDFIIFTNSHQLYHLQERLDDGFFFNLILVDEASQLPTDYMLASLQYVYPHKITMVPLSQTYDSDVMVDKKHEVESFRIISPLSMSDIDRLTKLIVVGDYNQLPPVQPVDPPKKLMKVLESAFSYYVKNLSIPNSQLSVNYRSNQDIVDLTSSFNIYKDLQPAVANQDSVLPGALEKIEKKWLIDVMNPRKKVCSLLHPEKYDLSISRLEAELSRELTIAYYKMVEPQTIEDEVKFWREKIGVVAPHNAQGRLIVHLIFDEMYKGDGNPNNLTHLDSSGLMELLRSTVYSVERFQGSDRDLIIASIGISDIDQLKAESEFIYDLNRFNVLTSRAKHKVIMIASEEFLRYIPNELEIMEKATKIQDYALEFCNIQKNLKYTNDEGREIPIKFRYHSNVDG